MSSSIKIQDGQFHVRSGKKWFKRTNFTFDIVYEVSHQKNHVYVVMVTREDGKQSSAHFKATDCHNSRDMEHALNSTYRYGGLMCSLSKQETFELLSDMVKEKRQTAHQQGRMFSRTHITNAGLQPGSPYCFLNPSTIFNINTGEMVNPETCPLIWLSDIAITGLPKEELMRYINPAAPDLQPFCNFMSVGEDILGSNFGAAILSWAAMLGLHQYQWICTNLRHFNLPLLFGEPMVGKTLIAMCGAWLSGCRDTHIASRCTLAFVNSWLTRSTLPFVWDDPSSVEDVSQLAIDLANGAVRGKATEDAKTPLTACLVTANFDMQSLMKYFSRLVVLKIVPTKKEKMPGDAKVLEDHAKSASSALPTILKAISLLDVEVVNEQTAQLKLQLPGADLRILEGIAYPLAVAKVMTGLCDRAELMGEVMDYVEDVMIPYYKQALSGISPAEAVRQADVLHLDMEVVNANTATIVKGCELAMRKESMARFLESRDVTERVKGLGGRVNKTVRLDGVPTKCHLVPKVIFSDDDWQRIIQRIFQVEGEEQEEQVTESSGEEDQLPSNNSFSLPPPPPPPTAAADDDSLLLDVSLPLPPPPTANDSFLLDVSFPPPPPDVMEDEVMEDEVLKDDNPEPLPAAKSAFGIAQMANLMSAIPASPGNRCAKCRKIGRPGSVGHVFQMQ